MEIPDVEEIRQQAKIRWFSTAEICQIFANYESLDLLICEQRERPTSGSFFMIPRQTRRKFRKDGYLWCKKKDGRTIQESHVNLKVGTVEVVECLYVRAQENENFQRRVYCMIKEGPFDKVLFHYREEDKEAPCFNSQEARKTTAVTTQSPQGTAKTIPILGVTGDGMPNYRPEFENQPFSQETNSNVHLNRDTPRGYYEQFSERNEKNLKGGRETSEDFLINSFDGYQDCIIPQQNPDLQDNWKKCKHSKTLDISKATGFPSSIVDHAKLGDGLLYCDNKYEDESHCNIWSTGYGMQDCNDDFENQPFLPVIGGDDFLPDLSMPGSPRELPGLMEFLEQHSEDNWKKCKHSKTLDISKATGFPSSIVDHAKLGDGLLYCDNKYEDESYCNIWFTGYGMQDCNDDFENQPFLPVIGGDDFLPDLSMPGSPRELPGLMEFLE